MELKLKTEKAIDDDGIWIEYGNAMIQVAAVTYAMEVDKMKIDLDDKWCITSSNHCNVILVKKSGRLQKDGTPAGQKFYYQNFGQAVKDWIQKAAISEDINSFQELANFIDGKLNAVELKIDQQVSEYEDS